jgi:3-dehydroquinate dehydratase-1
LICVSLAEPAVPDCVEALKTLPFAEIRMDKMQLKPEDVEMLFSARQRLIATCRPGQLSDFDRKALLLKAIESGAAYVDVEVESDCVYRDEIIGKARSHNCLVIVSFHDHQRTPARHELEETVSACFRAGADIAKIACMVHSNRDSARLLGLLDVGRKVVVIGMGQKGKITRIAAPFLGSPFTFASLSKGKETAEGQLDQETLRSYLRLIRRETEMNLPSAR